MTETSNPSDKEATTASASEGPQGATADSSAPGQAAVQANDGREPLGPKSVDRTPAPRGAESKEGSDPPRQVEYRLRSPRLPLAVYREVAAHLRQVEGVTAGLLPQTSTKFDYLQSQIGGIWIRYRADALDWCQPQVEAILTYYGDRYGNWETMGK